MTCTEKMSGKLNSIKTKNNANALGLNKNKMMETDRSRLTAAMPAANRLNLQGSYRFSVAKFPDFSSHGMIISLTLSKQQTYRTNVINGIK